MYSAELAGTAILASAPAAANAPTYFLMVASSFCWIKSRRASDDALDTEGKDYIISGSRNNRLGYNLCDRARALGVVSARQCRIIIAASAVTKETLCYAVGQ